MNNGNGNNEEDEEDGYALFETGELILVTLVDGTKQIGEFVFETDAGLALKVGSKTARKNVLDEGTTENLEEYREATKVVLNGKTLVDLAKLADQLKVPIGDVNRNVKKLDVSLRYNETAIEEIYRKILLETMMNNWIESKQKSVLYMKELNILIRTFIPWERIAELEAAEEVYEEMQLQDFAKALKSGGTEEERNNVWNQKIEEWKNDGIK